jgi:hypothetical protein
MAFSIGNTATNTTWSATNTATVTISVSAGSIILLNIAQAHASVTESVSSVTSSHLTFAHRTGATESQTVDAHLEEEVWWAYSSGALTNEVITVTSSGTPATGAIAAIECKGVSSTPFDTNASLPVKNNTGTNQVTGVSTDSAAPVGLLFHGTILPPGGLPTGWTQAALATNSGTFTVNSRVYYKVFSAQQSNATWTLSSNGSDWVLIGDAFSSSISNTITASQGSYSLTGEATTFGILIPASQGTYTLTGEATVTNITKSISPSQGTYTLTGRATTLNSARSISLTRGLYTLTGFSTSSTASYTMSLIRGLYTLAGNNINLIRGSIAPVPSTAPPTKTDLFDTFSLWSPARPPLGLRRTRIKSWIVNKING